MHGMTKSSQKSFSQFTCFQIILPRFNLFLSMSSDTTYLYIYVTSYPNRA